MTYSVQYASPFSNPFNNFTAELIQSFYDAANAATDVVANVADFVYTSRAASAVANFVRTNRTATNAVNFVCNNDTGLFGHGFALVAEAAMPGLFLPVSFATSAAAEVVKNRGEAIRSGDAFMHFALQGVYKNISVRTLLLTASAIGVVGATVAMSGCVSTPSDVPTTHITYVGGNNSVDATARIEGTDITIGPNAHIGQNVDVTGNGITLRDVTLEGHRNFNVRQFTELEGVYVNGNDILIADSSLITTDRYGAIYVTGNHVSVTACDIHSGLGQLDGNILISGDHNNLDHVTITARTGINGGDNSISYSTLRNTLIYSRNDISGSDVNNFWSEDDNRVVDSHLLAQPNEDPNSRREGHLEPHSNLENVTLGENAYVEKDSVLSNGTVDPGVRVKAGSHLANFFLPERPQAAPIDPNAPVLAS